MGVAEHSPKSPGTARLALEFLGLHGGQGHQVLGLFSTTDAAGCRGRFENRVGARGLDLVWKRAPAGSLEEERIFDLLGWETWLGGGHIWEG